MKHEPAALIEPDSISARREFLKRCGRFAAVTPPAMAMLLSVASVPTEAHASTWGGNNNNQGHNQGGNRQGMAVLLP
jgi:hypothetical protein